MSSRKEGKDTVDGHGGKALEIEAMEALFWPHILGKYGRAAREKRLCTIMQI
jgi:hypothetical protein